MITTEMLKALWCPICREGSLVSTLETESNFTMGELKCETCDAYRRV